MAFAYIGLGSNLGDRKKNLDAAADAIASNPGTIVVKKSTIIETDPVNVVNRKVLALALADIRRPPVVVPAPLIGKVLPIAIDAFHFGDLGDLPRHRSAPVENGAERIEDAGFDR